MEEPHENNDLQRDTLPSVSDITVLQIYRAVNNDYIKDTLNTSSSISVRDIYQPCCGKGGTAVAQWLRFCATNRKVAGSIPDCFIGISH